MGQKKTTKSKKKPNNDIVLFFGNGLNRAYGGKDWSKLIAEITDMDFKETSFIHMANYKKAIYEYCYNDSQRLKKEVFESVEKNFDFSELNIRRFVKKFVSNIITTNYDLNIENNICPCGNYQKESGNKSKEITRNLFTVNEIELRKKKIKVWHIHGLQKKNCSKNKKKYNYSSIMIDLYSYISQCKKIHNYLYKEGITFNGSVVKFVDDNLSINNKSVVTWVDLFFNKNVHIVGYGLDQYMELDVWMILMKRFELICSDKKIKNRITYWIPSSELRKLKTIEAIELLSRICIKTEVVPLDFDSVCQKSSDYDYKKYYREVLKRIEKGIV